MAGEGLMARARRLAERGRFTTAPNPLVGAVVVRDGEVIGEGWHVRAGEDHAEIAALKSHGAASYRGATMYVTLEPCNHYGRTPPCTEAILKAGLSKIVVGHLDPNPKMRGRSIEMLRDAGVEVEVLNDAFFERQNEQFAHRMRTGRPFVHLKLAATLDGRIAARSGDARWVTGEAARLKSHYLRAEAGAVLVGANTARADDPLLTARGLPEKPPPITRVVLDPRLSTSPESRLVRSGRDAPVLIFAAAEAFNGCEKRLVDLGVEVVPTPRDDTGLDLRFVLEELGLRGVRGVLVEGGGKTAGRFVEKGLADKLTVFYAPKVVGSDGVPMVGALGLDRMGEAPRFAVSEVERIGEDVALTLYPEKVVGVRVAEEAHVHRVG